MKIAFFFTTHSLGSTHTMVSIVASFERVSFRVWFPARTASFVPLVASKTGVEKKNSPPNCLLTAQDHKVRSDWLGIVGRLLSTLITVQRLMYSFMRRLTKAPHGVINMSIDNWKEEQAVCLLLKHLEYAFLRVWWLVAIAVPGLVHPRAAETIALATWLRLGVY